MDEAAVLGPVDPQLGDLPAAALVRVVGKKPIERLDDRTLLMADVAEKALRHMKQVVRDLLADGSERERAETIAEELAGGHYTHDDPITVAEARALGLPVAAGLPHEAYDLMELYPAGGPPAAERAVRARSRTHRAAGRGARRRAFADPECRATQRWQSMATDVPHLLFFTTARRARPADGEPAGPARAQGAGAPPRLARRRRRTRRKLAGKLDVIEIPTLVLARRPEARSPGSRAAPARPRSSGCSDGHLDPRNPDRSLAA